MTNSKTPPRDAIGAILSFATDEDQTPEEAAEELKAAGVDVEAFLARLDERVKEQEKAKRLAWLAEAQERVAKRKARRRPARDYSDMDHDALVKMLQERQAAGQQVAFHKLEDLDDADLRTLLLDLDDDDGEEER
jgi:hypothetical protein